MYMQVKNRLSAVCISIYYNAIAIVRKPAGTRNISRRKQKMSERFLFVACCFIQRIDVGTRNYQNMRRSLWAQIVKRDADVVFMNLGRRYVTCDDLAENTIHLESFYQNLSSICLCDSRIFFYPLDVGTDRFELSDDPFIPSVDVIDALDNGFALRAKCGENE